FASPKPAVWLAAFQLGARPRMGFTPARRARESFDPCELKTHFGHLTSRISWPSRNSQCRHLSCNMALSRLRDTDRKIVSAPKSSACTPCATPFANLMTRAPPLPTSQPGLDATTPISLIDWRAANTAASLDFQGLEKDAQPTAVPRQ